MQDRINEFITYITFRCNYKCKMCTQDGIPPMKELSGKEWDIIFEDIEQNLPDTTLILLGGEPLLHPDFVEIIERATYRNIHKHVVTNGCFLEKFLPDIKRNYCGMTISIDGIGETHDKIRNHKGAFEKAESALKKIYEMNHNLLPGEKKMWFALNFVLLPDNIDEIYDYIDRMLQYEPEEIILNHPRYITAEKDEEMRKLTAKLYSTPYIPRMVMREDTKFSKEYAERLNEIIKDVKKKYDPAVLKEFPDFTEEERLAYYNDDKSYSLKSDKKCLSPYKIPFLFPDGSMASCLYNNLGKATEEGILDLWQNKAACITREYIEKNGNFPTCAKCTPFYKEECDDE
ncbi:MAG: radical SAM protein [Candidatus Gastranaerophilales bacterium]|nr:radical SAM protein [Candidatus Gastranaerophilales bacterium]